MLWPIGEGCVRPARLERGGRRPVGSSDRNRRLDRVTLGPSHRSVRPSRRKRIEEAQPLMRPAAARLWLPASVLFLAAALLVGVLVGPVHLGAVSVVRATFAHVFGLHSPLSGADDAILWELRLPRVILAALVGGTLAAAGASYQGVFRNPLADPYLLGAAAGAGLGVDVARVGLFVVVAATIATAAAVAVAGLIGFVGIIVPHTIRLLVGGSYRLLLPLSVIVGAGFLVFADVIARTVMAPQELPIGVVTAFFGAPFFAVLLRTTRRTA